MQQAAASISTKPFTAVLAPGEWPGAVSDLPLMLTQYELAHLRGLKSIRTLQRERRLGRSIPYTKDGRKVLYPRADVLAHFGARAT